MTKRRASIKETGEELSPAEWERFDAAVAAARVERELPAAAGATPDPVDAGDHRDERPRRD